LDIKGGPFWVYVLQNPAGKFYVGSTDNLSERIKQHNPSVTDYHGLKYTHKNGPWKIIYYESYQTRSKAMAREKFIKSRKSSAWIRTYLLNW
jgi:putative endonuclease